MKGVTAFQGTAVPFEMDDVDTDQIIPSEFLKVVDKRGIGRFLFYRMRYDEQGRERPDFVLNEPRFRGASVLVAGKNFGIGSSRENAVWAIVDYGIKCVVASSFGDIFQNNANRNGLLCVKLDEERVQQLRSMAKNEGVKFSIDVAAQTLTAGSIRVGFELDPYAKRRMIEGVDEIALTLESSGSLIEAYERLMPPFFKPKT